MLKLPRDVGCQIGGCEGKALAKALCQKHYNSARYSPRFYPSRVSCKRTVAQNIAACTKRDTSTGCLEWTGHRDEWGYGRYGADKRAHRVSYAEAFGPIPDGMLVCHRCDNPRCVNPAHLFLGSNADNVRDRNDKGRYADTKGEKNPASKLTETQVREIRKKYANGGITQPQLALEYGFKQPSISDIIRRKTWSHI